jgi:pimeloyl-ACP methyl ester carboxylesterase
MKINPHFLEIDQGGAKRRLAVLARPGAGPCAVWLGGFRSDMMATKAEALDAHAAKSGRAFLRFDYSGHGQSSGRFEEATVGQWLADTLAVMAAFAGERPLLCGSSMGAHLALLATRRLAEAGSAQAPSGLILIAPAIDFTERLLLPSLPEEGRLALESAGMWLRPSAYSPEPYPITRRLIEEGRKHLLLSGPIRTQCPVHILQGGMDPDVPAAHAETLLAHLPFDPVSYTLIPDGDHRLSREADIAVLLRIVASMAGG